MTSRPCPLGFLLSSTPLGFLLSSTPSRSWSPWLPVAVLLLDPRAPSYPLASPSPSRFLTFPSAASFLAARAGPSYSLPTNVSSVASGGHAKRTGV